jgi:hypothetical protein
MPNTIKLEPNTIEASQLKSSADRQINVEATRKDDTPTFGTNDIKTKTKTGDIKRLVRAPNSLPRPGSLPNTAEVEAESDSESDSESEAETKCETESFPMLVAKETGKHLAKLLFDAYFSKSVDVVGKQSSRQNRITMTLGSDNSKP